MDKVQIRINTPVSEFLSRFKFGNRKSGAKAGAVIPDKNLSLVDTIDEQDSLFTALDLCSAEQSDIKHLENTPNNFDLSPLKPSSINQHCGAFVSFQSSSPRRSCVDLDSLKAARDNFTPGNTDREDFQEGSSDIRSPSRFVGIRESGEGDDFLTYKRRTRIGGQKRKNPDDRELDGPENERGAGTNIANASDQASYKFGKVSGKSPRVPEGFGRAETVSTIKTWKKVIGPQKTLPPKPINGQLFLDCGQPDFSHSTCRTCGLLYARGHENDENVHKTFHRNCTQGIIFKGWQSERVASRLDNKGNRVIIVLAEDTHHQAKVREVIDVMELELGLTPGWLLQRSCKVYLFISSSKKIVGCLMAEPIKSAFQVVPAQYQSPGEGSELRQCEVEDKKPSNLNNEPQNAPDKNFSQLENNASGLPATCKDEMDQRKQGSNDGEGCLFPKFGAAASSDHATSSGSFSAMSASSVTGDSPESRSKVKGVLPHAKQEPGSVRDRIKTPKITDFFALKSSAVGSRACFKSEWNVSASKPGVEDTAVKVDKDEGLRKSIFVSGQDQQLSFRKPESDEKFFLSNVSEAAEDKGKPLDSVIRNIDVQDGDSREDRTHRTNVLIFGNIKFSREMSSRKRASKEQKQDLGSAILCTKTPVPAVCGVRAIWVSHIERRKGIASHLLDAMQRKTFCLGVVLEPSQFSFSQPTSEGRKFVAHYCQTNEFLVYTTS